MEWRDGLVGSVVRSMVADASMDEKWLVFDGPVDALWIENMNSVLDDNKCLCLANGERIKLSNSVHLIFEVADLAVASPATVSRCGMVYMDPLNLGWKPIVQSWLNRLTQPQASAATQSAVPSLEGEAAAKLLSSTDDSSSPAVLNVTRHLLTHRTFILSLFDAHVDKGLAFVRKSCGEIVRSTNLNLVTQLCRLFAALSGHMGPNIRTEDDERNAISIIFFFSYVWSIGGTLTEESQDAFDSFVRKQFDAVVDCPIPTSGNVFSLQIDFNTLSLVPWSTSVSAFKYSSDVPFTQMMVPTVDTVKISFLLELLTNANHPTLLVGSTGVGKSMVVVDYLSNRARASPLNFLPIFMTFSAQTSSAQTQMGIEAKMEKLRKNLLGAPSGFRHILFIDDLNMPKLDEYGSQPVLELCRQWLDSGGVFDREKMFWKRYQDLVTVGACQSPGGGRNPISSRLLRHFSLISMTSPSEQSLQKIFKSILDGFLKPFTQEVKGCCDAVVNGNIELFNRMRTELLPTPARAHYTFNMRDLSKVIQGTVREKGLKLTCRRYAMSRQYGDDQTGNGASFCARVIETLRRSTH